MKWNNGTLWLRSIVALALLMGLLSVSGCGNKQPAVPEEETSEVLEIEDEQAEDAGEGEKEISPRRHTRAKDEEEKSEEDISSNKKNQPGVIALETRWEGGVLTMPCTVNGLKLRFIFDTGASSVCISSTEALFMLKNGYLDEEDIGESSQAIIANGDIVDSTDIILREIIVGGIVLKDVEATVTHGLDAPLLFGQSAIRQLGTIQIRDGEVTIVPGTGEGIIEEPDEPSIMDLYQERLALTEEFKEQGWCQQNKHEGWWFLSPDAPAEAKKRWYILEARGGSIYAMKDLGDLYAQGIGVAQDFAEAYKWYRMAAEKGDASGQFYVGVYFEKGKGVKKDLTEACRWYAQAAAQGIVEAQYNLGNMYYFGRGVPKNDFEASRWYLRAAEQGHTDAQFNLACCYHKGEGVSKNISQAIHWYKKAAEGGNADALNNLGSLYEDGIGVPRNKREALRLYKQAADIGGDEAAERNYRRLLREKEEHDRRIREQREWEQLMRR